MPRVRGAARHGTFPTTADMGLWARAPTAEGLLEGLGLALYGAMTERRRVRPLEHRHVTATGVDPPSLAVAFLNELILQFQTDGFLGRTVRVTRRSPTEVEAELVGEPFDADRHPRGIEVKAVTMHRAVFDAPGGQARIVLDI